MSNRKKNSNGALKAPVSTTAETIPFTIDDGIVSFKKPNGKPKKTAAVEEAYDALDIRELLQVLSDVKNGNFSARMSVEKIGIAGKICDTLNEIIILNETLVSELDQARNIIGR